MHVHSLRGRVIVALIAILALPACSESDPSTEDGTATTTTTTQAPSTTASPETPDTDADQTAETIEVAVSGGQVEMATDRVDVDLGTVVRIQVTADVSDEVHVHGYDLLTPVTPTTPGVLEFPADIPGVFEVELEGTHLRLVELEVG